MLAVILPFTLWFLPETRSTFWAASCSPCRWSASSAASRSWSPRDGVFRDVEHLLVTVLLPWFFLTPIFWSFEQLPRIDEQAWLVDILHYGNSSRPRCRRSGTRCSSASFPSAATRSYAIGAAVVALALGALVFQRVDDQLAAAL